MSSLAWTVVGNIPNGRTSHDSQLFVHLHPPSFTQSYQSASLFIILFFKPPTSFYSSKRTVWTTSKEFFFFSVISIGLWWVSGWLRKLARTFSNFQLVGKAPHSGGCVWLWSANNNSRFGAVFSTQKTTKLFNNPSYRLFHFCLRKEQKTIRKMLSLHEGFPMFPTAHHPHHPHHSGVVGGVMGPGGGVGPVGVGHSTTPPHHAHHHHHHAAAAIHNLTARHHSQGPPPPPSSSSVAGQLNLHHAGHHQGPHHPHSHLNSHHQMAANQAAYFGYPHPHHWGSGGGGGGQGVHHQTSTAPNAAMEHQQQFQVGGLVTADGGNSWHPSPAAVYSAGLSSSLSPRTPVASVGYEEWANSPSNNNGQQQQSGGGGGVSSPDASPHFVQQPQGGGNAANGPTSPLSDQQQQQLSSYSVAAAAAYGKLFVSSGGSGDFISPHHAHLHHAHHHNNHAQMADPHRMNAGVITGHHSPDSGLAGSDGLSSAGSPAQQQQQGMLGGGSSGNNLINLQQQQQQQQNAVAAQGAMTGPSSAGSMSQQNQQQLVGSNGSAMVSRPQAAQSPYGWMKKPSYHNNNVNPGEIFGFN